MRETARRNARLHRIQPLHPCLPFHQRRRHRAEKIWILQTKSRMKSRVKKIKLERSVKNCRFRQLKVSKQKMWKWWLVLNNGHCIMRHCLKTLANKGETGMTSMP